MRWKTSMLVIGCLALVLFTPAVSAGQSKNDNSVPVNLTFTGGGIVGSQVPGYIRRNYGYLTLTETAHRITFDFTGQNQTEAPVPPNCYVWGAEDPTYTMEMPEDLWSPTSVFIRTYSKYEWLNNQWKEAMDDKGWPITLDLLKLAPGTTAYVQMALRLQLATTNDMYDVNFNVAWRAAPGYGGSIFKVTAGSANSGGAGDMWTITPLNEHLPYLAKNEANIRVGDLSDFRKDPGGTCTLGNYSLPFVLTVVRQ